MAVSGVSIDRSSAELVIGETLQLSATVTPSDATDQSITWTSSNTNVATVISNGMVRAISEGRSEIKASAGGKSSVCVISVRKKTIAATSVTLNKTSLALNKGESATLVATVKPDDATFQTVSWTSSDSNVASVDSKGKVTAISNGNATITAKVGDKEATCTVTVTVPIESISLNKTELTLDVGQSETLIATIKPDDATEKKVTWSSANPGVAAVVETSGKVIAMGGGQTTISAKVGNKEATCIVTIKVPVESVILDRTNITLNEGESTTLKATITPKDADDKVVTWSSSDGSIVSVDQDGTIHAIKQGSADILAKAGDKQATCTVTVVKKATSVTLDKGSLTLLVGNTATLTATVLPDDATDKTIKWESSNPNIATVDNGIVNGISPGETTIIATAGNIYTTCNVLVITDSETGVFAMYTIGNYEIINDIYQPGSTLVFKVVNYSSETIHVVSEQLIDGQTGIGGDVMSINSDILSGASDSWTIAVGEPGIYSPTARFTYLFKGETFTCEARIVHPKAPPRHEEY